MAFNSIFLQLFKVLRLVLPLAIVCWLSAPAHAENRVALVIGNAAYMHTPRLENPGNDAADVANTFRSLGFKVIEAHDLDKAGMDRSVREFAEALSGAKVGLFYYAGHGLQVGGQNFLVPVDAALITASALDFEMVRLDLIHRTMEQAASTNIIILDACRDNPLSRNLARALGTRSTSIGRGLAAVESGQGTLISFSTQPGSVALDGDGRNSPFASALIKHASKPGDNLSGVLINVRNDVMAATGRRQVPWEHSALTAHFYFLPIGQVAGNAKPGAAPQTYEEEAELAFWNAVKDSGNALIIKTYLDRFPSGTFSGLAKAMTEKLATEEAGKVKAKRVADLARAEAARKAAEALSDATRSRDVAKQSEALLKTKDEAIEAAERDLAAAEKAAEIAREAAQRAKAGREMAAGQAANPLSTGGIKVAALPEALPAAKAPGPAPDPSTLTERLQSELKRVGCDPGDIDGNWGAKAREALTEFAQNAKLALPVDDPTEAAYDAVVSETQPVCALSCNSGDVERDRECAHKDKGQLQSQTKAKFKSKSSGDPQASQREQRSKKRSASRSESSKSERVSSRSRSSSKRDCTPLNGPYGRYENPWCK